LNDCPSFARDRGGPLGAADAVFEQEAADLATLEGQMQKLTGSADFQTWSRRMSALLTQTPKREIYIMAD